MIPHSKNWRKPEFASSTHHCFCSTDCPTKMLYTTHCCTLRTAVHYALQVFPYVGCMPRDESNLCCRFTYTGFWWGNMKERDHLEKLGTEERITKTDFKEMGWKGVDWIRIPQHGNRWRAVVNTVLNHKVPLNVTHSSSNLWYDMIYLTLRRLMSYIYGAPILDVSRSHTTTQHSR